MTGRALEPSREVTRCPKNMVYGPCGGVEFDGSCEVAGHQCVFLGHDLPRWDPGPIVTARSAWPDLTVGASTMATRLARGNVIVADFPARAMDIDSLAGCASTLLGLVDAVLVGDSAAARVQFPPAYRAHLISQMGLPVWSGVNCRDRNRVALQGEIAALAASSVAGVHCVTGDHPLIGHRPDAAPVFDLDSTRLAALARSHGHLVSVAESPAAPPTALRPARLAEKVRAGADVCFINHCGPAEAVADFIDSIDVAARPRAFVACVPVVVDSGSAALLKTFTSLVLPAGYLDRILASDDPYAAGIRSAVQLSEQMLTVPGVSGVNLSGGPAHGSEVHFAGALAQIGRALAG